MHWLRISWAQQTFSAKAGISRRTASRIDNGTHRPKRGRPRDWKTRQDPLDGHWKADLLPMLERDTTSTAHHVP